MKELIMLLTVLMLSGLLVHGSAQRHALERRLQRMKSRHSRAAP